MIKFFFRGCLISSVLLLFPYQATGQVKTLLENDQVRIYEATIAVGAKTPEHTHPVNEATYILSGGKIKITLPDGTTRVRELKTGEVLWGSTPETHIAENIGDTEMRFLGTVLKQPQANTTGK
jgi:quercetin dioxygenase-like cupin family protein